MAVILSYVAPRLIQRGGSFAARSTVTSMPSALPSPWRMHEDMVDLPSGQAIVFKVYRPGDTATYALKRLKNTERGARFDREVDAMHELTANGLTIVPVIVDSGVDAKGRPYYVMPWYDEGSLDKAALTGRYSDPVTGIRTLLQLVDAMEALHLSGWAHRDLKPANILLDGGGLLLCDLGLAIPAELDDNTARLTDTLEAVGSRYYIAPENESGISDKVDQRPADFYAFAKISWVLLTGRPPLARELQLEQPNRVATVTKEDRLAPWDEVCEQLLRVDARTRLADWTTVRSELESILTELGVAKIDSPVATTDIEALASAARRYARSSAASEIRTARAARAEHEELAQALRREVWDAAVSAQGQLDIHGASGGLVQGGIGTNSSETLAILIAGGLLEDLPELAGYTWDEQSLMLNSAASMSIDGVSEPQRPSAVLGGYVLTDHTRAWMLRVPFIKTPSIVLLPSLTARFRAVNGPYRLGLPSARRAAQELGAAVFATGVILARQYIDLLTAGKPVDDPVSWISDD